VRLDPESTDHHCASWSPDGNWIAYRRLHQGKLELAKAPLGGGRPVRLADATEAGLGGGVTHWSGSGQWIAYRQLDGIHVISPDGNNDKLLSKRGSVLFGFSRDSSTLYALVRSPSRKWTLAAIDVATGAERLTELAIPAAANVLDFSLHPDGKAFATSISTPKFDIWILEGFAQPSWWARLRRQ